MPPTRITWSRLLDISGVGFEPQPPASLKLSDEIAFSLSILTGATRHDRKLLRCDENGSLLVGNPWDGLTVVENDELIITTGAADSFTATTENKGVLVSTINLLIEARFRRVASGITEIIYIAPNQMFWYPGLVYSVEVDDVPEGGNITTVVGITAYN